MRFLAELTETVGYWHGSLVELTEPVGHGMNAV